MTSEDNKISTASYIVNFYGDVEALTWNVGIYINMIADMKIKYPETALHSEETGIPIEERTKIVELIQNMKNQIFRTWVKLQSLREEVPSLNKFLEHKPEKKGGKTVPPKIELHYNIIKSEFIPTADEIELFVIELNKVFVKGIMGDILLNVRQLVEGYK